MRMNRRTLLAGAASFLVPNVRAHADGIRVLGGPAFGSYWRLTLPSSVDAALAHAAVVAVTNSVDSSMSPYRPESDLSRFNLSRSSEWLRLPADVLEVIAAAIGVAGRTAGAFEPTVGPIVARYGFGPIREGSVRCSYLDIDIDEGAARKRAQDLTIDLCGIAKGYALDRVVYALAGFGLDDFLLELGGEVVARGVHPSGRWWQVGVERPHRSPAEFAHVVRATTLAVATSSTAFQSYAVGERLYSHIIDARAGAPAGDSIASVTVLMPTGMEADAYATALVAMGSDEGIAFAERESIAALFQLRAQGEIVERMTASFTDFIEA